ncbi:hemoglobin subunit alpha-A-like [Cololabis saira]|uniref:hemoglobin subunit alpha-A-like n=1 Tax=Cololabis saira TaxID=129043 RepID=UPI002AD1DBD6|nr:hemoglobin subunit alpha-A-like [Cololabis saira]
MSLTAKDKGIVVSFWNSKAAAKANEIGAQALASFINEALDLGPDSAQVKKHGATIIGTLGDAVGMMDDLVGGLNKLSELHAFKLRVDPANFKILAHNIILVLAMYFPEYFTPEVHTSVDKFLQKVALALAERYR